MVDKSWRTFGVRASDLEREDAAHRIEAANREGRLSLAEAEQRLALAYTATYRYELRRLVDDLPVRHVPAPGPGERDANFWLLVHIAVVVGLTALLVYRWVIAPMEFFWPIFPLSVFGASLAVHVWFWLHGRRRATIFSGPPPLVPDESDNS
nr:DUF1707 domain-containing protein [Kibdelosporangium sp. MJ126-NF4]CEL20075.1 hypothetical protein [Kibdelosporangium sp. MJ126-NF4]CTQ97299.1 hypothetical protein [Kibdelosporangium sp. MJ126-NF4]